MVEFLEYLGTLLRAKYMMDFGNFNGLFEFFSQRFQFNSVTVKVILYYNILLVSWLFLLLLTYRKCPEAVENSKLSIK